MKGIKNTFRMAYITIKHAPFFLVYGIVDSILGIFQLLLPIQIIDKIVGYYYNWEGYTKVFVACLVIAIIHYLINVTFFTFNRLYNHYYRIFAAKYEVAIYKKAKEIDYDKSTSSAFLNDFQRAIDEGASSCVNSFWSLSDVVSNIFAVITIFIIFASLNIWIIFYAIIMGTGYFFLSKYNAKLYWQLSEAQKQNYRERGYVKRMFYLKDTAEDIRTTSIKNVLLDFNDHVSNKVLKNTDIYLSKRAILAFSSDTLVKTIYPFALGFLAYYTILNKDIVSFTALTVAASSLGIRVTRFASSLSYLQDQSAIGEAIFKVLDLQGNIEKSGTKDASSFECLNVEKMSFGYRDELILKDISMRISKGDKLAIVGENGAGKTTFVKLLLRLYDPNEGRITYNGEDYVNLKPGSIRQYIGAVFQDFQVYAVSFAENVLLRKVISSDDEELVIKALQFSGLYDKVKQLEKGIYTQVTKEFDKNGCELSKGERQKLVISRAYAANYDLLILDEPNSALDPLAEAEIYDKMMKLGQDKTLIFISHRLSTTINADMIYLFEDGRIVEKGTHHELMALENGKYQYMFNIQAQNYVNGKDYEDNQE